MNKKQESNYQQQIIKNIDKNIQISTQYTPKQQEKIKRLYEKSYKTSNNIQQDYKKYQSTNTQANLVCLDTSNSTLSYEAVKQKSYLDNKGIQMFEDVNFNSLKPAQKNNMAKKVIKNNILYILKLIKQFRQIKQQIKFEIQQQRIQFFCIFEQIIRYFYQCQWHKIHDKREKPEYKFDLIKESFNLSMMSSQKLFQIKYQLPEFKHKKLSSLLQYCTKLEQQKMKNEKNFQQTLKSYRDQIQIINNELQKKFSSLGSCKNCASYKDQSQKLNFQQKQIVKYKKTIIKLENNHENVVKKLEKQIILLQQQFQQIGRKKNQNKQKIKDKQKQLLLRQSQVQYRLKFLQQKQKQLDYHKQCLQNQRILIDSKREKLTSYELKLERQQRFQIKQEKQQNIMKSQYFSSLQKKQILRKYQNENHSRLFMNRNSGINQRLRQLQVLKNNVFRDYVNSGSRNKSKESQYFTSHCTSIRGGNYYQGSNRIISPLKNNSSNSTIRLSQKLERLSSSLKKDLQQIK